MKNIPFIVILRARFTFLLLILFVYSSFNSTAIAEKGKPVFQYTVSMPEPASHYYHMELSCTGWTEDTIDFKLPNWMPGYYQLMYYSRDIENISAWDENGKKISLNKINDNTWNISGIRNTPFILTYDVKTSRQFVANSYLDSTHAYIVPENNFLYIAGFLNIPVSVKIIKNKQWSTIATGLEIVPGIPDEFTASDFDILYDCPILIGNLEELPSFKVNGVDHRFIGYDMGNFDKSLFMENLKKVVEAAVAIFGDVPYKQYTFLGIGHGFGGIEHLNNTTISFDGTGIKTKSDLNNMMSFIGHEYFHNYNVKRIRPFELGPFDYDNENKTNQLWVSEGLTVYYEYMIAKRAGLIDEKELLSNFTKDINAVENNPGRLYQSLSQCSYSTWDEGPFGTQGKEPGKSISYYDKGPVVGLLLDFAIRNATQSKKSLDDVMRLLYWKYYKRLQRGFTDAEFQEACETVAGISLTKVFEYVYTTKELDYATYLSYAGLKLEIETDKKNANGKYLISRLDNMNPSQYSILQKWLDN